MGSPSGECSQVSGESGVLTPKCEWVFTCLGRELSTKIDSFTSLSNHTSSLAKTFTLLSRNNDLHLWGAGENLISVQRNWFTCVEPCTSRATVLCLQCTCLCILHCMLQHTKHCSVSAWMFCPLGGPACLEWTGIRCLFKILVSFSWNVSSVEDWDVLGCSFFSWSVLFIFHLLTWAYAPPFHFKPLILPSCIALCFVKVSRPV